MTVNMRILRIVSAVVLLAALFVTIDLGMNALYSLLPEIHDGITSRSMFIRLEAGWTRERFFRVFEASAWVTFAVFAENMLIWLMPKNKKVKG